MGNLKAARVSKRRGNQRNGVGSCQDLTAPICECCTVFDRFDVEDAFAKQPNDSADRHNSEDDIKELVVIGSGPHALSLMLRLLEPDAEFLTEKERHARADFKQRMRSLGQVRKYLQDLAKGPSKVLKPKKKAKNGSTSESLNHGKADSAAPPLDLKNLRQSVLVLDQTAPLDPSQTGWLASWKRNFSAIQIPYLRSPMTAHADPYDHRVLEQWAEQQGRGEELVTLPHLKQRDGWFRGPYQAPSTPLFLDYHDLLASAYGIQDMVQSSVKVISVTPKEGRTNEPYFELQLQVSKIPPGMEGINQAVMSGNQEGVILTVKTKRVVCAMGPMFRTGEAFWEASLRQSCPNYPTDRILHAHQIVPWLLSRHEENPQADNASRISLLIVGGGVTSAQLALLAQKSTNWCRSVKLIQRSEILQRQFDLGNEWMGPRRGKLLDEFWSLNMADRAKVLKTARKGGSIPPEVVDRLHCQQGGSKKLGSLNLQEKVDILDVTWKEGQFHVALNDGSPIEMYDMIWLATGGDNDISLHPALAQLQQELPVDVVQGLPVLTKDLNWKPPQILEESGESNREPEWKQTLRQRLFVMGAMASLELGPDALNLLGARHGAVRVAKALRKDMNHLSG